MNNIQNVCGNQPDQQSAQNPAFYTGPANFGQPIFRPAYVGNVALTAVVDHQKWLEKQQKDRNFQQQRERLREFSNTASQNISTETRIKNMIDKLDKPRINQKRIQPISYSDKQPNVKYSTETVNKTADWSDFNDVQHLYVKPIAFTGWKEVPEAYRTLELAVTRNGAIDIQLLYPILMSSGLSRETLGYIWSLSSCTTPGSLNRDELYTMIGLVAIAQNGYIFSSVDVLHQFSHPPIPKLDFGLNVQMSIPIPSPNPIATAVAAAEAVDDEFDDFQSASVDGKPYHAVSSNVGSRLASYGTNVKPQELTKARTVNALVDDEFTEFQQATVAESKPEPLQTNTSIAELDLMSSQEDKYSVFRQLDIPPEIHRNDQQTEEDDEEFGDFLGTVKPHEEPTPQVPQVAEMPKNNTWDRDLLTISETNSLKSPQSLQSLPSFRSAVSTVEGSPSEMLDATDEFGDFISYPVGGSASVESQSVSSLEMAIWDMLSVNGGGKTSPRADSVPSLELKISDEDTEPDVQTKLQSLLLDRGTPIPADRYSLFGSEVSPQDVDAPHSDWNRCLESCCKLVSDAVNVFNNIVNPKVCEEVIQSEEGSEFIENIAEVYRVACRVASSAANFGLAQDDTTKLVDQIRKEWKNLIRYFEDTDIKVEDLGCNEQRLDSERIAVACGVCLLDVEGDTDQCTTYKLSYGGRQYHTTCANFWINCVDSLLPAVPFPRHV